MKSIWKRGGWIELIFGLVVGLAPNLPAAEQTWTGRISDSMCGASHAKMIAAHPGVNGAKMTDTECTLACVRAGAKYVFVSGANVYSIANQDVADLHKDAGQTVRLTGEMNGDTITVSKIALAAPAKRS